MESLSSIAGMSHACTAPRSDVWTPAPEKRPLHDNASAQPAKRFAVGNGAQQVVWLA